MTTVLTGSFRLHWQDFSNKRFGAPMPPKEFKDFPSREEAEQFRAQLCVEGSSDFISTIIPTPSPRKSVNRGPDPSELLPVFSAGMRLTR